MASVDDVGRNDTGYRVQIAQPPAAGALATPVGGLPTPVDRRIADIARRQHGVIARQQLRALGLSRQAIQRRVDSGRLHPIHRGVYAVGHARLSDRGRWSAAVLACGEDALLSHRSAGALRGVRPTSRAGIDVTSPGRRGRTLAGIDAHRGDTLHPDDRDEVDGIPCTSVARTLLDLAEVVGRRQLERACDQAEILRLFDLKAIDDVLDRAHGRHGAPILRAVLADHRFGTTITKLELEERFFTLCAAAAFPPPEVNGWLALPHGNGFSPDFMWAERRLTVETDSRTFHDTRHAFEHDRRRDQLLAIAGWRVIRFTHRQVFQRPDEVTATLAALLYPAAR